MTKVMLVIEEHADHLAVGFYERQGEIRTASEAKALEDIKGIVTAYWVERQQAEHKAIKITVRE